MGSDKPGDSAEWPPKEQFADRLSRLRRARPMSNQVIADAIGLKNSNTVSNWQGGQKPEGLPLIKLARLFNVTPEWLLTGDMTGMPLPPTDEVRRIVETPPTPYVRKRKPAPRSGTETPAKKRSGDR